MESSQSTESAVPVKRKRGRPRKNPVVQPQPESSAKQVIKDSSVSSVKSSSVCIPDQDNVTSPTTPRRRGRPRKNPEKSESLSADQGSSSSETQLKTKQQYTCVHCGVVKDYSRMSLHMLQEHYRVWDPSNPEGVVNLLRVIKRFGKLVCKKCQKQFNSAQYYTYHCKWCGREDERAICPVCNTSQKAMWLHAHILAHKRKEKNTSETSITSDTGSQKKRRKAAERALEHIKDLDVDIQENSKCKKEQADDYNADSEEGSDNDDDEDYVSDSESLTENRRISVRKVGFRKYPEFQQEAHRLTKEYYANLADISVLPSCLPVLDRWKHLSYDMAEVYLPKEMTSIKFEVCSAPKNKDLEQPLQLEFGESCDIDDGFIAYCGGAIWGLDWCPIPEASTQYLAVACHRDFDHVTVLDQTTVGPGVIQIWNLGQLKFRSKHKSKTNLEFIIALDDGVILDLKWCPVGGYIKTNESTNSDRLGLLAVATSSGLIHIYSIPLPSKVKKETCPLKVYKVEPVKTLCQNFLSQPDSPCLCLSWFVNSEITRLAGGFADGTISVWDPSSVMTLQSDKSKNADNLVRPFLTFLAHGSSVTGVDFCPSSGDFLVSCGYERNVRHWDLREPDSPFESCQLRSKLQSVCWSPFFPVVFTASDQCYAVNSTATYCVENTQVNLGYINLYLHDGCAWDVGYSRWTNSLVSCDVVGDITWMSLPFISNSKVQQKTFAKRRKNLMRISKKKVSGNQTDTSLRPPVDCRTDDRKRAGQSEHSSKCSSSIQPDVSAQSDYNGTPHSSEQSNDSASAGTKKSAKDATEHDAGSLENGSLKRPWKDNLKRYVLNITFFDKEGPPAELYRELKPLDDMVQSLNRVVFSPNISCCSWVACGGQAGLLFVKNIPALASKIL